MATATTTSPDVAKKAKTATIYGRLSFPSFTAQEAFDRSQKGDYPAKSVAEAKPDFTLLLEQAQLDKLRNHIETEFLPYCIAQEQAGEKRDKLSASEVDDLRVQINKDDFSGPYNTPFKALSEKSAELAPECVVAVKCIGPAGGNIELKAIVNDEAELNIPDPDILQYPVLRGLDETTHEMYPGCYVAATVNLYAYHNGKLPGFSAGVSVAVFKTDADRFGGGVSVDESEIFMD